MMARIFQESRGINLLRKTVHNLLNTPLITQPHNKRADGIHKIHVFAFFTTSYEETGNFEHDKDRKAYDPMLF